MSMLSCRNVYTGLQFLGAIWGTWRVTWDTAKTRGGCGINFHVGFVDLDVGSEAKRELCWNT